MDSMPGLTRREWLTVMPMNRCDVRIGAVVLSVVAGGLLLSAQRRPAIGEWPSYGGTNWSQKYSALDQINKDNFKGRKVAWTWRSPDHELLKTIPEYPEMPLSPN